MTKQAYTLHILCSYIRIYLYIYLYIYIYVCVCVCVCVFYILIYSYICTFCFMFYNKPQKKSAQLFANGYIITGQEVV